MEGETNLVIKKAYVYGFQDPGEEMSCASSSADDCCKASTSSAMEPFSPYSCNSSKVQQISDTPVSTCIHILALDDDALQEIFSHLTFDEIAKARAVSRRFNEICQKLLNKGFFAVQRYHSRCMKEMKSKLPRRESERRVHPLARHIDVLTGIETRLSLLSMTYYKYIVTGVFCFIPGKVLDECYRVLREIVVHKNPPRSYELLQELRDISSMAMEHFDEHIVSTLKKTQMINATVRSVASRSLKSLEDLDEPESVQPALSLPNLFTPSRNYHLSGRASPQTMPAYPRLEFSVQQNRMECRLHNRQIAELKAKLDEHQRKIVEQERLLTDYGRKIMELEMRESKCSHSDCSSRTEAAKNQKGTVSRKRKSEEEKSNKAQTESEPAKRRITEPLRMILRKRETSSQK